MPKVSVIIPTYNRAQFIVKTVQSVLAQTYKDFEIVVVDDGSTDNTKEKLEPFKSKIKLIEQPNSERAVARNNGVANSNGLYIALLDSDDLWTENKLEKQVEILDNNPDVVLTYGQCLRIDEDDKKIKTAKRQLEGFSGNVFEELLMRNFIASPTPTVRRECFEKTTGFQTKYIPYEDWEFWLRFSLLGKFHFLNEPFAYYRIHKNQSVQSLEAEKIERVTTLLLEDSFKLTEIPQEIKDKSMGLANLRFSYWYLCADQLTEAKERLRKARSLNPRFLFSPKWLGLNLLAGFPALKHFSVFDLGQYH